MLSADPICSSDSEAGVVYKCRKCRCVLQLQICHSSRYYRIIQLLGNFRCSVGYFMTLWAQFGVFLSCEMLLFKIINVFQ